MWGRCCRTAVIIRTKAVPRRGPGGPARRTKGLRMGSLLRLLTLQVISPVLRPLIRLIVGAVAIPVFRLFVRRVVSIDRLGAELTKDLEQWVRGSLLLLVATANIEYDLL